MRLFTAVPVPAELRERMAALGKEIRQEGIVPVKPENMHLTLKFLGETDERKLAGLEQALRGIRFAPFSCIVKGVGVFPDEHYIKVVWAGVESGGKLEALAKDVQQPLRGFGDDERFSAHITIARVKRRADLRQFLEKHRNDEFGAFTVSSFELIQSVLGPEGPKYSTIAEFEAGAF
ncbi:MAG: RNA 2',3'-cyclic phosphodiesterase [Candidatus ainarchaeum sp.]|nr:RNA 2',3'-cyclic phosphodiesterase [Candidatus ainarchaeum sp.]